MNVEWTEFKEISYIVDDIAGFVVSMSIPLQGLRGGRIQARLFHMESLVYHLDASIDRFLQVGKLVLPIEKTLFEGQEYTLMLTAKPVKALVQVYQSNEPLLYKEGVWREERLVVDATVRDSHWDNGPCKHASGEIKMKEVKCCGGTKYSAMVPCKIVGDTTEMTCRRCKDYDFLISEPL